MSRRTLEWEGGRVGKRQRKPESCVYCVKPATDRDHVPPKGLFPKGQRPWNLVTVPSCKECNGSKGSKVSLDDEYLRDTLALHVDGEGNPLADATHAQMMKKLAEKSAQGLKQGYIHELKTRFVRAERR